MNREDEDLFFNIRFLKIIRLLLEIDRLPIAFFFLYRSSVFHAFL